MPKNYKNIFILSFLMLNACDNQVFTPGEPYLVIQDDTDVEIDSYDTLLWGGYYDEEYLEIDFDKNAIPDFCISAYVWGSPGMGQHPRVRLLCLHPDAFIATEEFIDTIFHYMEYDTTQYDNHTYISIYSMYDCREAVLNSEISSIAINDYASAFYSGDTIFDQHWKCDTLQLSPNSDSYPPLGYELREDTSIYTYVNYLYDCHIFPQQTTVYIATKTVLDDRLFIGWIKLTVINSATVAVFETAVKEMIH
jgi:hypothetical protein